MTENGEIINHSIFAHDGTLYIIVTLRISFNIGIAIGKGVPKVKKRLHNS